MLKGDGREGKIRVEEGKMRVEGVCACVCVWGALGGGGERGCCNFMGRSERSHCRTGTLVIFEQRLEGGDGASCVEIWRKRVFWVGGIACAKVLGQTVPGLLEEQ